MRIATTSAVCTQSEITTLSRAVHPAAMDMPRDSDGIVMNTAAGVNEEPRPLTSAIGMKLFLILFQMWGGGTCPPSECLLYNYRCGCSRTTKFDDFS